MTCCYQWQRGGWPECSCPGLPVGSRGTQRCGTAHCLWPWSCTAPPGGRNTTLPFEDDIILDHHEIIQFKEDLSLPPNPPSISPFSPSANAGHHTLLRETQSWGFTLGERGRWTCQSRWASADCSQVHMYMNILATYFLFHICLCMCELKIEQFTLHGFHSIPECGLGQIRQ